MKNVIERVSEREISGKHDVDQRICYIFFSVNSDERERGRKKVRAVRI